MSRNNSNENNVHGMSVTDWSRKSQPKDLNQRDVASNILDNIRGCSSVMRVCAVHLSMCHHTISQVTNPQVSSHYIAMNEVGWFFIVFNTSSDSFCPTSFYYNGVIPYVMSIIQRHRGVMI